MSELLYLSRARLKAGRGEALAPLARALLEGCKGETAAQAHRVVWMLFNDGEGRPIVDVAGKNRLFLWREKSPGEYYILSRTPPWDGHDLFSLETKEFAPSLSPGDVLRFSLRANPVVARKKSRVEDKQKHDSKGRERGIRCDIVMDALVAYAGADGPRDAEGRTVRAQMRAEATAKAAHSWIEQQGRKSGFTLLNKPNGEVEVFLSASNYETVRIPRIRGQSNVQPATFGVLDFEGLIEVTDPALFLARLADGFGKAKAFGCGLMLIRRA
jgi:CRISPR system Cascade subunit CasE